MFSSRALPNPLPSCPQFEPGSSDSRDSSGSKELQRCGLGIPQVSREGASPGPSFTVLTPPSRSATWAVRSPLSLPSGACHSGITLFRAPLGGARGGRIRVACHKAVGAHGGERVSGDGPSFAACSPLSVCWWVFLGGGLLACLSDVAWRMSTSKICVPCRAVSLFSSLHKKIAPASRALELSARTLAQFPSPPTVKAKLPFDERAGGLWHVATKDAGDSAAI